MQIFVSAGHYPAAPGAAWRGFVEHAEASVWADALSVIVPEAVRVPTGPLARKCAWINARAEAGDFVVELHFNDDPARAGRGSETLYRIGDSRGYMLAHHLQSTLADIFRPDRGVKGRADLMLLNACQCPAVILEPAFVVEAARIQATRGQAIAALSHALGVFP